MIELRQNFRLNYFSLVLLIQARDLIYHLRSISVE